MDEMGKSDCLMFVINEWLLDVHTELGKQDAAMASFGDMGIAAHVVEAELRECFNQ